MYWEVLFFIRQRSFILFAILVAVSLMLAPIILLVRPFKMSAALKNARTRLDEEKKKEKIRKHENDLYPLW